MAMRRFELVEGTSSKFWEVEASGGVLSVRFGRIGTKGQVQRKKLGVGAEAAMEKLVGEKVHKGYKEVGGKGRAPKPSKSVSLKSPAKRSTKAPAKTWDAMKPKVSAAFARLREAGIASRQAFAQTLTDGVAEIDGNRGFAFYHQQDSARVRKTGRLMIAFGAPRVASVVSIGKEVKAALTAEGLHVVWNGRADTRLEVHASKAAYRAFLAAEHAAEKETARAAVVRRGSFDEKGTAGKVATALASIEASLRGVLVVRDEEWYAREKAVRARAGNKIILVTPTLTADAAYASHDGMAAFHLDGFDRIRQRAKFETAEALGRELARALTKAGVKKARYAYARVHFPMSR